MANAIVIAVLIVVAVFWWRGRQKTKAEVWEGVVEDLKETSITDSEGDTTDYYTLYIKLPDGATKQVDVKHKTFRDMERGDRVVKAAGELEPRKVS